jgi:hypothetical protein
MFELASRLKIRFPYFRGPCTPEDLWDVPLVRTQKDRDTKPIDEILCIDDMFRTLNAKKKAQSEDSLAGVKTTADEILDLQLSIIRHVFATRMAEQEAKKNAADRIVEKKKLLGIVAEKQEAGLRDLSVEELLRRADAL